MTQIKKVERILSSGELKEEQRKILSDFDRFNALERETSYATRLSYLTTLFKLGKSNNKRFEDMDKEDLKEFISIVSAIEKKSSVELGKAHLKRFFRWLYWHNSGEEEDLRQFKMPKCVSWISVKHPDNEWEYEDLPTEEDILKISTFVETQRDRALILTLWETGAEPIAVLNLKIKDVEFNQYGGIVTFRLSSGKLKTKYRYREIPIATSVPDLQLWLSMHPQKDDSNAPLWTSRRGGALGYTRLRELFLKAKKKANVNKQINLYKLRHKRLTDVADVLNVQELKKFAGHSKYSNVTPRYIHVNEKAMKQKIYRERGVAVEEKEKVEPALKVKMCPRCKHENSPTFKFCAMCSMPLDMKTMFEVHKKGELLTQGTFQTMGENNEYGELMQSFFKLQEKNPDLFRKLTERFWENVAMELLREQQNVKAVTP